MRAFIASVTLPILFAATAAQAEIRTDQKLNLWKSFSIQRAAVKACGNVGNYDDTAYCCCMNNDDGKYCIRNKQGDCYNVCRPKCF